MEPAKIKSNKKPENIIRDAIRTKLMSYGWHVFVTHGNAYQSGFPDLYAIHKKYGYRWIEVKQPVKYQFTVAQRQNFPLFSSCSIGIWILTSADDYEIDKLFKPANWWQYIK